jgi:hypothetical protein
MCMPGRLRKREGKGAGVESWTAVDDERDAGSCLKLGPHGRSKGHVTYPSFKLVFAGSVS